MHFPSLFADFGFRVACNPELEIWHARLREYGTGKGRRASGDGGTAEQRERGARGLLVGVFPASACPNFKFKISGDMKPEICPVIHISPSSCSAIFRIGLPRRTEKSRIAGRKMPHPAAGAADLAPPDGHNGHPSRLSWTSATVSATVDVVYTSSTPHSAPGDLPSPQLQAISGPAGPVPPSRRAPDDKKELEEHGELLAAEGAVRELEEFLVHYPHDERHGGKMSRSSSGREYFVDNDSAVEVAKGMRLREANTMRAFVNKIHRANLTLQIRQPMNQRMQKYIDVSAKLRPLFKRYEDKELPQDARADLEKLVAGGKNESLLKLERAMIEHAVLNYETRGAVGETPIHLAFLLEQHELARKMICATARFQIFRAELKGCSMQFAGNLRVGEQELQVNVEIVSDGSSYETISQAGFLRMHQLQCASTSPLCEVDLLDGSEEHIDEDFEDTQASSRPSGGASITFVGHQQEQLSITLSRSIKLQIENKGRSEEVQMSELTVYISADNLDNRWKVLKRALDLPDMHVKYADLVAHIINTPYISDLDRWIGESSDDQNTILKDIVQNQRIDPPDLKMAKAFEQQGQAEGRCTTMFCSRLHPWPVRGMLHPWPCGSGRLTSASCKNCSLELAEKHNSGKDGGLFSGETALHIAIVQRDFDSVKWLIKRGASMDSRAVGVFFRGRNIPKFRTDKNYTEKIRQLLGLQHEKGATEDNEFHSGNEYGEYPFSFAVAVGHRTICNLLLEYYKARLGNHFGCIWIVYGNNCHVCFSDAKGRT